MNNIFVGNLSPDATKQDIRSMFDTHGTVERFRMMTDRETGQPRGFAFVEMTEDTAAEQAIAALNGTDLTGRAIHVNAARPQLYRNSGNGGSLFKKDSGEARTINDKNDSLPI